MKKKLKIILPVLGVIIIAAILYGNHEYNKGPKDVSKSKADIALTSEGLLKAYAENETLADSLYLNKSISVTGTIKGIETDPQGIYTINLGPESEMSSVSCLMDQRYNDGAKGLTKGNTVTIKGFCTGMLMDVILNRCVIDKK